MIELSRVQNKYRTQENILLKEHIVALKGIDRGKGVPSFDEMMDIALVEVDLDDPTTNVRDVAP